MRRLTTFTCALAKGRQAFETKPPCVETRSAGSTYSTKLSRTIRNSSLPIVSWRRRMDVFSPIKSAQSQRSCWSIIVASDLIDLLDKAGAHDPKFLLAYCELAKAHGRFFTNQIGAKPEELLVDHRSLAEIALQNARRIDPDAGELHLAQAYHFFRVTKDFEQARAEADLARRSLPNSAELEIISARVARSQGRWDDAVRFFQQAVALEPRGNDNRFSLAETYRYMRRYEDYDRLIAKIIETDPDHPGDLPLERAVGPLEQRADTRALRSAAAERAAANDLTEHDKVLVALTLAYCDRDAEQIRRILQATDLSKITNSGFAYPKAWFEALAEQIRKNNSGAKAAFASTRADVENTVLAEPGNGRMLSLLALIDAGL